MALRERIRSSLAVREPALRVDRARAVLTIDQWIQQMSYAGNTYPYMAGTNISTGGEEKVPATFIGLVTQAYKSNGVVFACMLARQMLFQEATFQFRDFDEDGRPGKFHWDDRLRILDRPWIGGTTADLNARAIQMADLTGTAFVVRTDDHLAVLRSDWTVIVAGSPFRDANIWHPSVQIRGYAYQPGGPGSGEDVVFYDADQVAYWAPIPDPVARFRGMPWTQTIIQEIEADNAATLHKRAFFANGATPNMVVTFDPNLVKDEETFNAFADAIEKGHTGEINAYKTLYLVGATDAKVIGANLQQLDFKATQGAGETRIAAAAGVPAAIVGISEGLQGSSLNAGNYSASFRRFADMFARPNWRNWSASLETIVPPPGSNSPLRRARLWYDDRDIPALRQDLKEQAEVTRLQADAASSLIQAGYTAESVRDTVQTGEFSKLRVIRGVTSVQLQPASGQPGEKPPEEAPPEQSNGKVPQPQEA